MTFERFFDKTRTEIVEIVSVVDRIRFCYWSVDDMTVCGLVADHLGSVDTVRYLWPKSVS